MAYQTREVAPDAVKEKAAGYPFALLYGFSEIRLCRTEETDTAKACDWVEARYFAFNGELHVFRTAEGDLRAVEVLDAGGAEDAVDRVYRLGNRFVRGNDSPDDGRWNALVVREYLVYDEDGQARVGMTRLKGLVQA